MAAIEQEDVIRLAEVPPLIPVAPGDKPPNFKSVYRWVKKGKRGVRLELVPGARKLTTRQAVVRFLARVAGGDDAPAPAELAQGRRRELAAKNKALIAAGR